MGFVRGLFRGVEPIGGNIAQALMLRRKEAEEQARETRNRLLQTLNLGLQSESPEAIESIIGTMLPSSEPVAPEFSGWRDILSGRAKVLRQKETQEKAEKEISRTTRERGIVEKAVRDYIETGTYTPVTDPNTSSLIEKTILAAEPARRQFMEKEALSLESGKFSKIQRKRVERGLTPTPTAPKEPKERTQYTDAEGIRRFSDTHEPVREHQKTRTDIHAERKAVDIEEKTKLVKKGAGDLLIYMQGDEFKKVAPYMGMGTGFLNRIISTDKGTPGFAALPQEVVRFKTLIDLTRDALVRKQTGAALNLAEIDLYRTIVSGLEVTPETLKTKLEAVRDFVEPASGTASNVASDWEKVMRNLEKTFTDTGAVK